MASLSYHSEHLCWQQRIAIEGVLADKMETELTLKNRVQTALKKNINPYVTNNVGFWKHNQFPWCSNEQRTAVTPIKKGADVISPKWATRFGFTGFSANANQQSLGGARTPKGNRYISVDTDVKRPSAVNSRKNQRYGSVGSRIKPLIIPNGKKSQRSASIEFKSPRLSQIARGIQKQMGFSTKTSTHSKSIADDLRPNKKQSVRSSADGLSSNAAKLSVRNSVDKLVKGEKQSVLNSADKISLVDKLSIRSSISGLTTGSQSQEYIQQLQRTIRQEQTMRVEAETGVRLGTTNWGF